MLVGFGLGWIFWVVVVLWVFYIFFLIVVFFVLRGFISILRFDWAVFWYVGCWSSYVVFGVVF